MDALYGKIKKLAVFTGNEKLRKKHVKVIILDLYVKWMTDPSMYSSYYRQKTLDPLQQAFIDHTAFQSGFCTPGILMSTKALLHENPSPTQEEVKEALSGHFCRCISHYHVLDAVMAVVQKGGRRNA